MLEKTPSILRNKVIRAAAVEPEHSVASSNPFESITTIAPNSSVITIPAAPTADSICNTSTTTTSTITAAGSDVIIDLTVTNKLPKGIIDRDVRRIPKPSAMSDRNLYNKQLQIITNTMGGSLVAQGKSRQQSQVKAIFQRYTEDDEFALALCDGLPELNNNRAYV